MPNEEQTDFNLFLRWLERFGDAPLRGGKCALAGSPLPNKEDAEQGERRVVLNGCVKRRRHKGQGVLGTKELRLAEGERRGKKERVL